MIFSYLFVDPYVLGTSNYDITTVLLVRYSTVPYDYMWILHKAIRRIHDWIDWKNTPWDTPWTRIGQWV